MLLSFVSSLQAAQWPQVVFGSLACLFFLILVAQAVDMRETLFLASEFLFLHRS